MLYFCRHGLAVSTGAPVGTNTSSSCIIMILCMLMLYIFCFPCVVAGLITYLVTSADVSSWELVAGLVITPVSKPGNISNAIL